MLLNTSLEAANVKHSIWFRHTSFNGRFTNAFKCRLSWIIAFFNLWYSLILCCVKLQIICMCLKFINICMSFKIFSFEIHCVNFLITLKHAQRSTTWKFSYFRSLVKWTHFYLLPTQNSSHTHRTISHDN